MIVSAKGISGFTGSRWWEHKNPSYREACFRQGVRESLIGTIEYEAFMKLSKQ